MTIEDQILTDRLIAILRLIELPASYYELAENRYKSLSDWFIRENSSIKKFSPYVYPQGSFRLGTAIRPLTEKEEYDLDIVCQLLLTKSDLSQRELKELIGNEIKSYAKANSFKTPASEKKRCWRLDYADKVSFHQDILPAISEDESIIEVLVSQGVPRKLAKYAIAITDNRVANYDFIDLHWPMSNPKGYAKWFEERMRAVALTRMMSLVEKRAYAKVDDVPVFEWKTPLQLCIQLLKRHRDVMFQNSMDLKPISMIITTLASHAYSGQPDLASAMNTILEGMLNFVEDGFPRVGNPVNGREDFAERWAEDCRLEPSFRDWHRQVKIDFTNIGRLTEKRASGIINERFEIDCEIDSATSGRSNSSRSGPAIFVATPKVQIKAPAQPWGCSQQ